MAERHIVRDLMTLGVQTCGPTLPVSDVARILVEQEIEGLTVLDHEGHAIGKVTEADLIAAYAHAGDADALRGLTAEDVMSEDIPELPPDIPLEAAAALMQDRGQRVVFSMHNSAGISYPAAVITFWHFLRHLAAHDDSDLIDLGIHAARRSPMDVFMQKRAEARRRRLGIIHQE